ncbi:MAG: pilus assembly protein PilN [Verrucomicrobiaceae bacterium]|nr:pilus assembly protein PilN [Verrucomicrobiaceae bacterium]
MARINLLPWREERRQELKKEFLVIMGGTVVFAFVVLLLSNQVYNSWIDNQNNRNAYLQRNIDELSRQVAEIKEMEAKRRQLLDRMKVIQDLQGTRPLVVHVFDELVRTLPDGVFYQSLVRTGQKIEISGVAESNNRVSSLMRQMDKSEWFENPNLTSVQAAAELGEQASAFKMAVQISPPEVKAGDK